MSPPLWFVVSKDTKHGPFTAQQLVAFAQSGKLQATHKVQHDVHTGGSPVAAGSIRDLQKYLKPPTQIATSEPHLEDAMIDAGKQAVGRVASSASSLVASVASVIPKRPPAATSSELESPTTPNDIGNFVSEGQDPKVVVKLLERVRSICTDSEQPLYAAVQQRPIANFSPDGIVLTNKRFIMFRQKVLGRFDFFDYPWRDVKDVHVREEIMASKITLKSLSGTRSEIGWLPKSQARKVYRIAQSQEEAAREFRRQQMLEEQRASAAQTNVTTAVHAPGASPSNGDPLAKLTQLKQMLDAGLITQEEFDAKKSDLLSQM
jgi:hypothetical protein